MSSQAARPHLEDDNGQLSSSRRGPNGAARRLSGVGAPHRRSGQGPRRLQLVDQIGVGTVRLVDSVFEAHAEQVCATRLLGGDGR